MQSYTFSKIRWRYAIAVGVFLALLSLYPQSYLTVQRGGDYNGAVFFYDYDESAYASYLQSLIDGKPRNNSIYLGELTAQEHETIFSIQFLPALIVSLPARLFGLSSESALLVLSVFCAFFSALTLFWFLNVVTENEKFASIASLFVLLLGPAAAGISILKEVFGLGNSAFYLTFLRRYTPAMAFPFIFILLGSVWLGLRSSDSKTKRKYGIVAGLCFAFLIYSYFFFWTAILVWLICIAFLNFTNHETQVKRQALQFWLPFVIVSSFAFVGYAILLFGRHSLVDSAGILENTRELVFLRPTLILGLAILMLTALLIKMGFISFKDRTTHLVLSFTILPVFVFNQQLVTGYSLQPMHYNMYVLNYLVLIAVSLLGFSLFEKRISEMGLPALSAAAILLCAWGIIETHYTTFNRYGYNQQRDEAIPVNQRLVELARRVKHDTVYQLTLNFDSVQADNQPTVAPQGVLWAEHLQFASNMSREEHRRRYFLYLYYLNRNEKWLFQMLRSCPNQVCRALVGWKVNPTLLINSKRVGQYEIVKLVEEYSSFLNNIAYQTVADLRFSYIIVRRINKNDFTRIDSWYKREQPEIHKDFLLYPVELKKKSD